MIALLSNPHASGVAAMLPRLRAWVAAQDDVWHEEVDGVEAIAPALARAAALRPAMLVLNGGDGTARAFLSEVYHGGEFGENLPPIAVLPAGKTNLIAMDLGAGGDPFETLKRLVAMHRGQLECRVVPRAMVALSTPETGNRPVLGMCVGGAGLAETILYCRRKLYPIGLPNSLCHLLAAVIAVGAVLTGGRLGWSPVRGALRLHARGAAPAEGQFLVLLVTSLERLLLGVRSIARPGQLRLVTVDSRRGTLWRAGWALLTGRFGDRPIDGVTMRETDEIRIAGRGGALILDGESYALPRDGALTLRSTAPMAFVSFA